ncbi:cytochrome P450 [Streptomyces sp. NBC_01789]|uniref:cytochrome P450 family protein n=1 Tax=Streptomyces sp. NBC_01789 TaxID=2975941 RepID=UPI002256836A|nr:cytochrome P450 [Streptomyces sp. NBC_01789]MCX4445844.1 cytochrome P450 [Streptomyces sp. NBC_01789]
MAGDDLINDPYGVYQRLRSASPVHRITGPDGSPAWIVTRYDDVRQALQDSRLSLDKRHSTGGYAGFALPPALDANLLNMDPPDHTRLRRLVGSAFTPGRIQRLREPIRKTAEQLLDPLGEHGRIDLIPSYAAPLAITVICDLLGVPDHHRVDFRGWTHALVAPDPARPAATREAVAAMLGFFTELLADKRRRPADDLLSDLIGVREASDALGDDELMSLAFLILLAGFENTVHLLGNAVLALLRHPRQLALVREDPALLPGAVEELARFDGPALLAIRRFATEDLVLGGVTVGAGQTVLLSLAAANRDPERFEDPDRLDIGRTATGHLALGLGIHYCLGATLARTETEIALATLFARLPDLRVAADVEPRWRPSLRSRSLTALQVDY